MKLAFKSWWNVDKRYHISSFCSLVLFVLTSWWNLYLNTLIMFPAKTLIWLYQNVINNAMRFWVAYKFNRWRHPQILKWIFYRHSCILTTEETLLVHLGFFPKWIPKAVTSLNLHSITLFHYCNLGTSDIKMLVQNAANSSIFHSFLFFSQLQFEKNWDKKKSWYCLKTNALFTTVFDHQITIWSHVTCFFTFFHV